MVRIALLLDALAFLLFAAWGLASPDTLLQAIGVETAAPGVQTEIRAMYGGLELGIAAGLAWASTRPAARDFLLFCAITFGGFVLGRGLGIGLEGAHGLHPILVAVESFACLTNLLIWRLSR